ncbi:hypothetical protein [Hymenobacter volaticus]|uniref:Uncharacterized protein n=1 Tax=Hymenobacter volaticus TaxID=2932254 RepID=A0ABY4GE66_9BACT|nr:hypothetical protein [Hymenobacter volaticus]UOQ69137.1 hypothetical protein MUN86_25820 [Hymenobacter volaticus]
MKRRFRPASSIAAVFSLVGGPAARNTKAGRRHSAVRVPGHYLTTSTT